MAEPERIPDDDRPDASPSRPPIARADWLVGAEEGVAGELKRAGDEARPASIAPKLSRPESLPGLERTRPSSVPLPPVTTSPASSVPTLPASPPQTSLPSWAPAPSSVPRVPTAAPSRPAVPAPAVEGLREFPMDDAEERARIAAQVAEEQAREAEVAARPHTVVTAKEFELPTVATPWWTEWLTRLRHDRRVQLAVVAVVAALIAFVVWPREQQGVSIAAIKQHPERWADHQVSVTGRVDEVFQVGGSWAWTLVQGRDTIVVFSRVRGPRARERVTVVGTVSRGWFGGESRLALFEATR
jgi:hypothetical protein